MTIKRNGENVILKGGKVSCSCCEEPSGECCMYPAQALADGLYSSSDLPDAISGGDYVRSGTTFFGPPNSFNVELIIGQNGFAEWAAARNYANPPFFDIGFVGPECTSRCLITLEQDLGQFCYSHEDQFADAYTVSGPTNGTVTRQSVCVWRGTGLTLTNFGYQWKVNGNNKSGFQNTPVGSYAGGYTVS
jgi:hypothetical protein